MEENLEMNEIILDCAQIADKKQLHTALAEALHFPQWYGNNLDALMDCLTELEDETHLVLTNWPKNATFSEGFASTFADAAEENSAFTYTLV